MKIKFITFALVTAAASLFGYQHSLGNPYQHQKSKKSRKPINEKILEADIIVVGGGAAGCVLMNRLSKKGAFSVLGMCEFNN